MSGRLLPDVNVLLALVDASDVRHRAAQRCVAQADEWSTTPLTETGFLRLVSNPRIFDAGWTFHHAVQALAGFRSHPRWTFLPDSTSLTTSTVITDTITGHNQVTDFHLVNLAASHGLQLATFDSKLDRSLAPRDQKHVLVLTV